MQRNLLESNMANKKRKIIKYIPKFESAGCGNVSNHLASEHDTTGLAHLEPQAIPNSIPNRYSQDTTFIPINLGTVELTPASSTEKIKEKHFRKIRERVSSLWGIISNWFAERKKISELWFERQWIVKWFNKTFDSWQTNVRVAIFAATSVLITNFGVHMWAQTKHSSESVGLWTIFQGDCKQANNLSLTTHAIISIMSTILLACSNYCMQLLASPTRGDVDKAHRRREWVDIGLQSFRNCWKRHISISRTCLWLFLGMSSTPLHLLWNSVIVFSPVAYIYMEITVSEGFESGLPFETTEVIAVKDDEKAYPDNLHFVQAALKDTRIYEKLDNLACQKAYANDFVVDRSDVIVVVTPILPETNISKIYGVSSGGQGAWPYKWLCKSDKNDNFNCLGDLFQDTESWKFPNYGNPVVKHCYSQKQKEFCKLEYSQVAGLLVLAANSVKVCCFFGVLWVLNRHARDSSPKNQLLITTGDAVASFLADPDPHTFDMSIVDKNHFDRGMWQFKCFSIGPITWINQKKVSKFRVIGLRRWTTGNVLAVILWLVPLIFLLVNASHYYNDLGINFQVLLRQLGLGKPDGLFLFQPWTWNNSPSKKVILNNTILSNTPQLAISLAYFLYNNQFTCMSAAVSYAKYSGTKKRGLRVTKPVPKTSQRASHRLSLPVKYALLLGATSTLLNWFASQAVFFARVVTLDHWLQESPWSMYHVGYSIPGIMFFTIVAFMAFWCNVGLGLQRLSADMPLASTCSASLSASCHPADSREKDPITGKWRVKRSHIRHEEGPVLWGVEREKLTDVNAEEYNGYCTFTSEETVPPKEGWLLG